MLLCRPGLLVFDIELILWETLILLCWIDDWDEALSTLSLLLLNTYRYDRQPISSRTPESLWDSLSLHSALFDFLQDMHSSMSTGMCLIHKKCLRSLSTEEARGSLLKYLALPNLTV